MVAKAINKEVAEAVVQLMVAHILTLPLSEREEIVNKVTRSMHHQFMELAGVDITKEPMEVGPTAHYVMGELEPMQKLRIDRIGVVCCR